MSLKPLTGRCSLMSAPFLMKSVLLEKSARYAMSGVLPRKNLSAGCGQQTLASSPAVQLLLHRYPLKRRSLNLVTLKFVMMIREYLPPWCNFLMALVINILVSSAANRVGKKQLLAYLRVQLPDDPHPLRTGLINRW